MMTEINEVKEDAGNHYRFSYKGINLDPFRIAKIYNMQSFALMTVLKKILCAGGRGHKEHGYAVKGQYNNQEKVQESKGIR